MSRSADKDEVNEGNVCKVEEEKSSRQQMLKD